MYKYFLKRLLIIIPSLAGISFLAFFLNSITPGDPVKRMQTEQSTSGSNQIVNNSNNSQYNQIRHKLGFDLPLFYVSIHSFAEPDTLNKIADRSERRTLERLVSNNGNWERVSEYYLSVKKISTSITNTLNVDASISETKDSLKETLQVLLTESEFLIREYDESLIQQRLDNLKRITSGINKLNFLKEEIQNAQDKFLLMQGNSTVWKNYIPVMSFYSYNQYHRWMFGDREGFCKGVITGDFGYSLRTGQKIWQIIIPRLKWSLFLAFASLLISFLVSVPLGIWLAQRNNTKSGHTVSAFLYLLYSMPVFWVASVLLMTFANHDVLALFPASGVGPASGYNEEISFWSQALQILPYLVLPLFCYSYGFIAFLSGVMKYSMLEVLSAEYIVTARSKGLRERTIIYRHAFRNALLPMFAIIANVFPLAIGGSLIVETIFSIPGMGYETYAAVAGQDYPVIIAMFTLSALFTMVGYIISDILISIADPRISFTR